MSKPRRRFESAKIVVSVTVDPEMLGLHDDFGEDDAVEMVALMLSEEWGPVALPIEFCDEDDGNVSAALVVVDDLGEHEVKIK